MRDFRASAFRLAAAKRIRNAGRALQGRRFVKLAGIAFMGVVGVQLASCGDSDDSGSSGPYTIGGSVSGLAGGAVTLVNNEMDSLSVPANGTFRFALAAGGGSTYAVELSTQPPGQVCTLANASGVIASADVTSVAVTCKSSPESTLYTFSGGNDGNYPDSGLTAGPDGNFYGTTTYGGTGDVGTLYRVTPQGAHTVLYSFTPAPGDGQYPASGLELGDDGFFYATTTAGGAHGGGTFFRMTLDGDVTTLFHFGANGSGSAPQGLTLRDDGHFYGTTTTGGANGVGTVFRITAAGVHTVLHSFAATGDGHSPVAGLSDSSDGYLYGVTYHGGANSVGTIFRLAPDGTSYAVLHSFGSTSVDGRYPETKLRNTADGNLYGSTSAGGASGAGTLFRFSPASASTTVLHSFAGGTADGSHPSSRLRIGADGNFYGVTVNGGHFDAGTFFRMTPAGVVTLLYSFAGGTDGGNPNSSLLVAPDGSFYGTTVTGGATSNGTIYRIRL